MRIKHDTPIQAREVPPPKPGILSRLMTWLFQPSKAPVKLKPGQVLVEYRFIGVSETGNYVYEFGTDNPQRLSLNPDDWPFYQACMLHATEWDKDLIHKNERLKHRDAFMSKNQSNFGIISNIDEAIRKIQLKTQEEKTGFDLDPQAAKIAGLNLTDGKWNR